MQAVAENWRNLTAVGALPLALTDNMNFGNPEKPEIMGEFAGAIEGMREACLALDYPVVSGNVSLYNETSGNAIWPAPVIGGVGLIADAGRAVDLALKRDGNALMLIGDTIGPSRRLAVSARDRGQRGWRAAAGRSRRRAPQRRFRPRPDRTRAWSLPATTCRMAGLLVALAEMAMAGGLRRDARSAAARYRAACLAVRRGPGALYRSRPLRSCRFRLAASEAGVPVQRIGTVGGAALTLRAAVPYRSRN